MRYHDGEPRGTRGAGRTVPAHPDSAGNRPSTANARVLLVAGAWLATAWLVGASGRLSTLRPPAPQLILVGVTVALLAAGRLWPALRRFAETVARPDTPGGRRACLAWNVVGLVDIIGVVLTAARLAFADPASMRALLHLPLSLLITFIVPIVIATHVWMLRRLACRQPAR